MHFSEIIVVSSLGNDKALLCELFHLLLLIICAAYLTAVVSKLSYGKLISQTAFVFAMFPIWIVLGLAEYVFVIVIETISDIKIEGINTLYLCPVLIILTIWLKKILFKLIDKLKKKHEQTTDQNDQRDYTTQFPEKTP